MVEINHQTVNFIDITFNLIDGSYIDHSENQTTNHFISAATPTTHLQLSGNYPCQSMNKFLDSHPTNKHLSHRYLYTNRPFIVATMKLNYSTQSITPSSHAPKRNIIWFNPAYSKNVRTNIGTVFLRLVDTHFPKSSALHKIFNRNTIKVSYSCMKNVKRMISTHNNTILSKVPTASTQHDIVTRYDIVTRVIQLISPSQSCDNLFITYLCLYETFNRENTVKHRNAFRMRFSL